MKQNIHYSCLKLSGRTNLYIISTMLFSLCSTLFADNSMKLVWSDEFNESILDTSKWNFDLGNGGPSLQGWGNNELEYYTSRTENVRTEDGNLIIEARKESFEGFQYTSSRIKTKEKGDWTYGRFEARAKLPTEQGIWPAIWMLPTDNYYGAWAASGEIDIMELLGHEPSKIYATIHYGGVWPDNKSSGGNYTLQSGDFNKDFHIFAIEWDTAGITWYVDSTQYFKVDHGQPFDKRFHWILNVAVGGNWPGSPDATTTFPCQMIVDYVRVYQKSATSVQNSKYSDIRRSPFNEVKKNTYYTISGRNCSLPVKLIQPFVCFPQKSSCAVLKLHP